MLPGPQSSEDSEEGSQNNDKQLGKLEKHFLQLNLSALEKDREAQPADDLMMDPILIKLRTQSAPTPVTKVKPRSSAEYVLPFTPRRTLTLPVNQQTPSSLKTRKESVQLYEDFDLKFQSPLTTPRKKKPNALDYAKELKAFSSDLIRRFTRQDFLDKTHHGARKIMDDAFNRLTIQVKQDILKESSKNNQQAYYNYYTHVLKHLLKMCDFHDAHAVYLGLSSPEILKLSKYRYTLSLSGDVVVYSNPRGSLRLPFTAKSSVIEALKLFSISHNYYHEHIKAHTHATTVPWMVPFYKKMNKIEQMEPETIIEKKRKEDGINQLMFDLSHFTGTDSSYESHFDYTKERPCSIFFSITPRDTLRMSGENPSPKPRQKKNRYFIQDDDDTSFSGYSYSEEDESEKEFSYSASSVSKGDICQDSESNIIVDQRVYESKVPQQEYDSSVYDTDDSSTGVVLDECEYMAYLKKLKK